MKQYINTTWLDKENKKIKILEFDPLSFCTNSNAILVEEEDGSKSKMTYEYFYYLFINPKYYIDAPNIESNILAKLVLINQEDALPSASQFNLFREYLHESI